MKSDVILFIVNVILFLVFAVSAFRMTSAQKNETEKKFKFNKKELKFSSDKVLFICTDLSVVLALLDFAEVLDFGGYHLFPLYNSIFGAVIWFLNRYKEPVSEKYKKVFSFAVRSFTVCLALEFFVFNFNSMHLFGGDYEEKVLDISSASLENFDSETMQNRARGYSAVEFRDINMPVGTVTFEAFSDKKGYVKMSVDVTDDTNTAEYRYAIATAYVLRYDLRSQTIPCNFFGNAHNIKFSFNADENETVTLEKITVNKPVMLSFSFIRFLAVYLGVLLIYLLAASEFFRKSFSENRRGIRITAWILTAALIVPALWIVNIERYKNDEHSIVKDFKAEYGNQMTQEIVDAFELGQTNLNIDMNEALTQLENPYDRSQRETSDLGYIPWDHLYYGGKYYSYYGIAPVLLVFLPYHKLTGYYFPTSWAVCIFSILGMIFLTKLYLCFVSKFFEKIRSSIAILGLLIIQLSSGIWFCLNLKSFYEIAQTSGFLCVTIGAFFMLSSNVIGEGKIKNYRVALSTLFLSLAVLCRPTLAIYCIAALFFIYAGFKKKKETLTDEKKSKVGFFAPYFLSAFIPFVVIGSVQIFYNYARFGNPFDFGIQYSLTINDFTSTHFHTHLSVIGFINFLFIQPEFTDTFPFFTANKFFDFQKQGYYFVATDTVMGMLWRALPVLAYIYTPKAYRLSDNKNKKFYALLVSIVCIICPFIIIGSIWESGYAMRYSVDFAWQLILGALIIAFIVYEKCSDNIKEHLNKLMIASAVVSFVLNFGQVFSWSVKENALSPDWYAAAMSFARAFEFWR